MMIVMMLSLLMMIVMMTSKMTTTLPSPRSRSPTRRQAAAPSAPREPVFLSLRYFFNCSSCRLAFWLLGSSSMAFSKLWIALAVSVFFA